MIKFLVKKESTIKMALKYIDANAQGLVFIVDDDNKLLGILSDGDIRRALLKGASLNANVQDFMNKECTSLPIDTPSEIILQTISNKIKIIPLVNKGNVVVDYASIKKIRPINIASPLLSGNELAYVTECIRTNWISSQGKFVRQFENMFSELHEDYEALAVSNGTVALHLALVALNIGQGDEVIVPDLTFAASINAILYTGATPVLADIDKASLNIDVHKIETLITSKTKAIMLVHLYGNPCDMDAIMHIADKHNLKVIEDAAEALGSRYKGKPLGAFGDVSTFSFFGNKTITTGEGGMVLFKDSKVAEKAAVLRDHGMNKTKRYWHDEVGFNYRLTNVQAAIGVAQLERLDEFVIAKRNIAHSYNLCVAQSGYFQCPQELKNTINSYWLYTLIVNENAPFTRDDIMNYLDQLGIETRPVFFPLHEMPPYQKFGTKNKLQNSISTSKAGFSLPSSVSLSQEEINRVCEALEQFINKNQR
jgi:perosamine synthetase